MARLQEPMRLTRLQEPVPPKPPRLLTSRLALLPLKLTPSLKMLPFSLPLLASGRLSHRVTLLLVPKTSTRPRHQVTLLVLNAPPPARL